MEKDITEDAKKVCSGIKELLGTNSYRPANYTLNHIVDVFRGGSTIYIAYIIGSFYACRPALVLRKVLTPGIDVYSLFYTYDKSFLQ